MWPVATDGVAWSVGWSVFYWIDISWPWALQNGWADRDAIWHVNSGGPGNHVLDWDPDLHSWRGNFEGEKGQHRTCPAVDILSVTQQRAAQVWIRLNRLCVVAMLPYVKLLWPLVMFKKISGSSQQSLNSQTTLNNLFIVQSNNCYFHFWTYYQYV